jgi:uncharacterized protein (DUF1501 family)
MRSLLGCAVTATIPSFLTQTVWALENAADGSLTQAATGKDSPILVVVQLGGGNDGLNTIVPFGHGAYYKARPVLAVKKDKVLPVNDEIGFNAALTDLKKLFDQGQMSIVQGVGYPNPNRSHFRSMEIWHTASDSEKFEKYGWIGRYFDNCCKGADPTVGVNIGQTLPQALLAKSPTGVSLENPDAYRWMSEQSIGEGKGSEAEKFYMTLNDAEQEGASDVVGSNAGGSIGAVSGIGDQSAMRNPLDYLERTAMDAQLSSQKIREMARKHKSTVNYPNSGLARGLKLIAQMIAGGLPTRVYYASQGGYDTHSNQANAHQNLLNDFNQSIASFVADLKSQGNFPRVLIMTFSEFGRRVAENGSGGTDHGTAAPMYLFGEKFKTGVVGAHPSLKDLDQGDLKYKIDFRSVYATVLEEWLKVPSAGILGRQFPKIAV